MIQFTSETFFDSDDALYRNTRNFLDETSWTHTLPNPCRLKVAQSSGRTKQPRNFSDDGENLTERIAEQHIHELDEDQEEEDHAKEQSQGRCQCPWEISTEIEIVLNFFTIPHEFRWGCMA